MACGKSLLISDSKASASQYFVKGNGFKFNPKSVEDFTKKSLYLLKNKKLLKSMSEKSYKLVKSYDINKSVDKLEEVYHSLKR
jgi:glycosyltransferase involved in cell wall biosynthesis